MGTFNNYVDKKKGGRGKGGMLAESSCLSTQGEGGSLEYPSEPKSKKKSSISR